MKLTEEQIRNVIRLEESVNTGEAHWCDISYGDLLHIVNIKTFEDEYDFEGELEDFLRETDIDNLDLAGIEVCGASEDERYSIEGEFYNFIDFATGYYDLHLYKLQNIEWRE